MGNLNSILHNIKYLYYKPQSNCTYEKFCDSGSPASLHMIHERQKQRMENYKQKPIIRV